MFAPAFVQACRYRSGGPHPIRPASPATFPSKAGEGFSGRGINLFKALRCQFPAFDRRAAERLRADDTPAAKASGGFQKRAGCAAKRVFQHPNPAENLSHFLGCPSIPFR